MIEVILGEGTTVVGAGTKNGRRFVTLSPNQVRREIGEDIDCSQDREFGDDDIVIWLDKPEAAAVLARAVNLGTKTQMHAWRIVLEQKKDGDPNDDVRGAS